VVCAARMLENSMMAIVTAKVLAVLNGCSEWVAVRSGENSSPVLRGIDLICRSNTVIRNNFLSNNTR
jgi:hypothetical protein